MLKERTTLSPIFLSRMDDSEVASLKINLELKVLVELQKEDHDIRGLLENQTEDSKYLLREVNLPLSLDKLWCEVSTGQNRPFV